MKDRIPIKEMKAKLDDVSPSFCLAKWYRTTLDLGMGETYSCHHCRSHKIDAEQIKSDPAKLTNTDYIIEKRQRMLFAQRPDECNYCWSVEDEGNFSDRIAKSLRIYEYENQKGKRDVFEEAQDTETVVPSHLEIKFDNTCNLKCSYCGPHNSSKWEEELKQYGPYPTISTRVSESNKILNREYNPYIEAFWEWWPEIKEKVETFRISGGEPLLSKHTYKLLDKMIEEDTDFNFSINTNLSVDIDPLLDRLKNPVSCFDNFILFTSLESNKQQSEYSRFGLNYELFTSNMEKFLENTNKRVHIMCTNNILSITGYYDFIMYVLELKNKYPERVSFEPTHLRYPSYLNIRLLPKELKKELSNKLSLIEGISVYERKKLDALVDYMNGTLPNEDDLRSDFVKFIIEYDKRRDTNFVEVYPDLVYVLEDWK